MFQKKRGKIRLTVILFFLALFVCVLFVLGFLLWGDLFVFKFFYPMEQTLTPRTQIISNSLPFNEVSYWSTKGSVDHLKIVNENLMVLSVLSQGHDFVILGVEPGNFVFHSIPNMSSLDADLEHVYVGFIDDVRAYDLQTGREVWTYRQRPSKGRGSMYVFVEDNKLKIYDYVASSSSITAILTLDTKTGELLYTRL